MLISLHTCWETSSSWNTYMWHLCTAKIWCIFCELTKFMNEKPFISQIMMIIHLGITLMKYLRCFFHNLCLCNAKIWCTFCELTKFMNEKPFICQIMTKRKYIHLDITPMEYWRCFFRIHIFVHCNKNIVAVGSNQILSSAYQECGGL